MRIRLLPVMLCALAALIAAACSQESAADSGRPAGKVIELSGTATATRAGVDRPLSVGSDVFADDEVMTADGAEIAITIAHNGARWVLGGGQKRKLIESAAWRAEKGSEAAAALDDDDPARTAAAGRHSEREAAETAASATEENKQAEAAPAAAEQAPVAAPSPAPAAQATPPPGPVPPPPAVEASPRRQAGRASAPRVRDDEPRRKIAESGSASSAVGDPEVAAAPPPPPPPQPETAPIAPPEAADTATSQRQTRGAGTAAAGAVTEAEKARTFRIAVGSIEADGALTTAQARAQAGRLRGSIGLCAKLTVIGKMTVVLSVAKTGRVTAVKVESVDSALADKFESCVVSRVRAARFPAASGATKVKLTVSATGE